MTTNDSELSKELEYLLTSYLFENKRQMKRLLSYLVQHANATSETAFDQRVIARECLGRGADFDPAENPVVRIEIGRLRKLLNRFYEEELFRPYKITIPLGQYRPEITAEGVSDKTKYLPELNPSPANPERLSVLLQFTTEGVDNPELFLLRHQIRIGITIALRKQEAIRLLVAIPGEDGKVADSIDFIMRVTLASEVVGYKLSSVVNLAESEEALFTNYKNLPADYQASDIDDSQELVDSSSRGFSCGRLSRRFLLPGNPSRYLRIRTPRACEPGDFLFRQGLLRPYELSRRAANQGCRYRTGRAAVSAQSGGREDGHQSIL